MTFSVINTRLAVILIVMVLTVPDFRASGFYVPGVAPTDFKEGEEVGLKAIKMTSSHTQLPYEYYSLPFCEPPEGLVMF